MQSEGNKFIEIIENLKVKQTTLKESILIQEEEKKVLSMPKLNTNNLSICIQSLKSYWQTLTRM